MSATRRNWPSVAASRGPLALLVAGLFVLSTPGLAQSAPSFEGTSREFSIFNLGGTQASVGAVSREMSAFNFGTTPGVVKAEAVSRELSLFDFGPVPPGSVEAVSRELSAHASPGEILDPASSVFPSTTPALGTRVVLTVVARGTNPFQYQWRFNGQNIPGANSSAYVIPSMRLADSGTYRCVVINPYGGRYSDKIDVQIPMEALWMADSFSERPLFADLTRQGTTNNLTASFESQEPKHAGKRGGHSLWLGWRAPASGVATFSTVGSNFDTLLAIYTGDGLERLNPLAGDEDSGGFFTSALAFNAVAGTEYEVAIDGFAGASGRIVLTWDLQPGTEKVPRIVASPESYTAPPGSSVTLRVGVESISPVTYQWLLNDLAVPGANADALVVDNFSVANVGAYRVVVTSGTLAAVSDAAIVELGSLGQAQTRDKFQDLFATPAAGGLQARALGGFPIVAAGIAGSQNLNNFGATTELGEPIHGDVVNDASRWYQLTAADDGIFVIDTIGSDVDTVLGVYTGTDLFNLQEVASDNNSAPDGVRSLVRFSAVKGTTYVVAVGGVTDASGNISLNWKLGRAARITSGPLAQAVCLGDPIRLSSEASGAPAPNYQWYFNGHPLRFQHTATLEAQDIREGQIGVYTVVASNDFGSDHAQATVSLMACQALRFDPAVPPRIRDGIFELQLIGSENGKSILIQSSSDLTGWTTIYTTASGGATSFSEKVAGPLRFYRALQQ